MAWDLSFLKPGQNKDIVLARVEMHVDVLNDAGDDGWELVAILPNNIAYLKREIDDASEDEEGVSYEVLA